MQPSVGSWPDWVQAALTALAFLIAAAAFFIDVNVRTRQQARLVYATLGKSTRLEVGRSFSANPLQWAPGTAEVTTTPSGLEAKSIVAAIALSTAVNNDGDELISDVRVHVLDDASGAPIEGAIRSEGAVPPHSRSESTLIFHNPVHPGQHSYLLEVRFRDAAGRTWRRRGAGKVIRIWPWQRKSYGFLKTNRESGHWHLVGHDVEGNDVLQFQSDLENP